MFKKGRKNVNSTVNREATPKQLAFARLCVEGYSKEEAYRTVYDVNPDASRCGIQQNAYQAYRSKKVQSEVKRLRRRIMKRHDITIEKLLIELEEARQLALMTEKAAPAVQATMGKAKLCGLDKQVIDHVSSDGLFPKTIVIKGLESASKEE